MIRRNTAFRMRRKRKICSTYFSLQYIFGSIFNYKQFHLKKFSIRFKYHVEYYSEPISPNCIKRINKKKQRKYNIISTNNKSCVYIPGQINSHIHENKNTHNLFKFTEATTSDEFKKSYHLKYGYISYQSIRGKRSRRKHPSKNIACLPNTRITNSNLLLVKSKRHVS